MFLSITNFHFSRRAGCILRETVVCQNYEPTDARHVVTDMSGKEDFIVTPSVGNCTVHLYGFNDCKFSDRGRLLSKQHYHCSVDILPLIFVFYCCISVSLFLSIFSDIVTSVLAVRQTRF